MLAAPEDFEESFISLSKIKNLSSSSDKTRESGQDKENLTGNCITQEKEHVTEDQDKKYSDLKQVFTFVYLQRF